MKSKILGQYKITYHCGITQIKNLISHQDFVDTIKPKQQAIYDLECLKENKKANEHKIKQIKNELKEMFSDNYFTDKSPLFEAHLTGLLALPEHCGGTKPCSVVEV